MFHPAHEKRRKKKKDPPPILFFFSLFSINENDERRKSLYFFRRAVFILWQWMSFNHIVIVTLTRWNEFFFCGWWKNLTKKYHEIPNSRNTYLILQFYIIVLVSDYNYLYQAVIYLTCFNYNVSSIYYYCVWPKQKNCMKWRSKRRER